MGCISLQFREPDIDPTETPGTGANLYLRIDGDIDAYYDELKSRGVKIAVDIRDFMVDIDGYRLTFNRRK